MLSQQIRLQWAETIYLCLSQKKGSDYAAGNLWSTRGCCLREKLPSAASGSIDAPCCLCKTPRTTSATHWQTAPNSFIWARQEPFFPVLSSYCKYSTPYVKIISRVCIGRGKERIPLPCSYFPKEWNWGGKRRGQGHLAHRVVFLAAVTVDGTSHLSLLTAEAVCSKSGCLFSHIVTAGVITILPLTTVQTGTFSGCRHVLASEENRHMIFFIITLLGQPTSYWCQQQQHGQSAVFSMAGALKTRMIGDFSASPSLSSTCW